MYPVTEEYQVQINDKVRNPSYIQIVFGLVDPDAPNSSTLTDDGHLAYSNVEAIDLGTMVGITYGTMEHNRYVLDGRFPAPVVISPVYQGYVGDLISGADMLWEEDPTITVDFGASSFEFAGFTFRFDPTGMDYPSEMLIKAYLSDVEVMSQTIYPDYRFYKWQYDVPLCDKVEFIYKKSVIPYRRARMTSLYFGLVQELTDADVISANSATEIDMISSKLPKYDFDFTILDVEQTYNPDNPDGVWAYLQERQPISAMIGYELDSGFIEWIPWMNGYSSGEIKVESTGVATRITIKGVGLIHHLTQEYDEGKYYAGGRTLADLAEDLMTYVGFSGAIELATELSSITTYVPLPKKKVNQLLQMIANAGRCILRVNRTGQIEMVRRTTDLETFSMGLANQITTPVTVKYPVLRDLKTSYQEVVVGSVSEDLSKVINIDFATSTVITISHSCGTDHSYTATGTVVVTDIDYYAYKTVVTLSGTGTIKITGKKIEFNEVAYTKNCSITGEDLKTENELVNSYAEVVLFADWVASVMNKITEYEVENRGYPELDPTDNILFTSNYSNNVPVTVTKNDITYNGAIRGKSKFLIGGDE